MAKPWRCPRCGSETHNTEDARQGYCGRCHDWTNGDLRKLKQATCCVVGCEVALAGKRTVLCEQHWQRATREQQRAVYRALWKYERRYTGSEALLSDAIEVATKGDDDDANSNLGPGDHTASMA